MGSKRLLKEQRDVIVWYLQSSDSNQSNVIRNICQRFGLHGGFLAETSRLQRSVLG